MRRILTTAAVMLTLAVPTFIALAGDETERKIDATHVKVGQHYRWKQMGGNQVVWEIVGRTDDEVTYKIHQTIAGKELPSPAEPKHFPLKKKVKGSETAKAKKAGDETLEVSGLMFPCTIYETETGGTTVRTWQSDVFPEGIKTQMGKDVINELVEVK